MSLTTLGGNTTELQNIINDLKKIKNNWDDVTDSDEQYYDDFLEEMSTLISDLTALKEDLERKGRLLYSYAKW